MKTLWLNKNNNKKLIIYFSGWGFDKNAIQDLDVCDFDILMFYDYRDIEGFRFSENIISYSEKYLICWSMGVYVSNLFKDILDNFDKKIALAGTPKIIDDNFGIPERIFNLTIKNFSKKSSDRFIQNMGIENLEIKRDWQDLKEELISIQNIKVSDFIDFDFAIIPKNDNIIPPKNQIAFWGKKGKIINSSHFVFSEFRKWSDILC